MALKLRMFPRPTRGKSLNPDGILDPDGIPSLHTAIQAMDLESARAAIQLGADINEMAELRQPSYQ